MGKHLRDERDSKNMVYIFGGALFLSIVVFIVESYTLVSVDSYVVDIYPK